MDCPGNQPSLCGEKLTIPVTAEDINRTEKTKLVCVDREETKVTKLILQPHSTTSMLS
jgi:hypothetical protein